MAGAGAAGAGVLSETDAVAFVRERGAAMARAAAEAQTGMSAVIGADETELLARLDELGLSPANYNGGGQIVVAGAVDALAQLAALEAQDGVALRQGRVTFADAPVAAEKG